MGWYMLKRRVKATSGFSGIRPSSEFYQSPDPLPSKWLHQQNNDSGKGERQWSTKISTMQKSAIKSGSPKRKRCHF